MQQQKGNVVKINLPTSRHNGQYGEVRAVRGDGLCEVVVGSITRSQCFVDTLIFPSSALETDEKMTKQNLKHK